jgi:hypothetical protein
MKKTAILAALTGIALAPLSAQASFLYSETFTGSSANGWVFDEENSSVAPYLTSGGSDPSGDGWLRMTESIKNQSTFAYYDTAFASEGLDINISFDFAIYDGTGADGFTFFLMDGSVDPDPGAFGGSLGYANRNDYNGNPVDGLAGGYLGIGFDEYGNFSNDNEGRNGGEGFFPNSVTLRGSGAGTSGYEYITHSNLDAYGQIDFPALNTRPDQSGADYRAANVTITADNRVTVQVQFGAGNDPVTVIDNFDATSYLATRPETLMFGFSSATGASKEIHEIRNLVVSGSVPVIPEPSTVAISALAILGIGGAQLSVWRKRRSLELEDSEESETQNS